MRKNNREDDALSVLDFLYSREIANGPSDAANFLGLAEVKLERKDVAGAVALLDRMSLVVDDGFDTLLPAAALLEKYGHHDAAARFIARRVQAAPWDAEAKIRLGERTCSAKWSMIRRRRIA